MKKIMWVKFGWSDYYRGGPVDGDFSYMSEGSQGHEAWNFEPGPDGKYRCYVPPQGTAGATPSSEDPNGWTVVCLAKNPMQTGVDVVGWYDDATLVGERKQRPGADGAATAWVYSIIAPKAYLVPPEARTNPFSHRGIGRSKYSQLAGPYVEQTENKKEVLEIIERELHRVQDLARAQPDHETAPDTMNDEVDPLALFGSPEHRKNVEKAAEEAVKRYFKQRGYSHIDRTKQSGIGYDFDFTRQEEVLRVEVKGTAAADRRFFLTRNEFNFKENPSWRLALVTNALSKSPEVTLFDHRQFKASFDLEPLAYFAKAVPEVRNA